MTALPQVRVGDRVRIAVEGKVLSVTPPGSSRSGGKGRLVIERPDGRKGIYFYGPGSSAELTVLLPEYADGGVYIDADGDILKYTASAFDGEGGWRLLNYSGHGHPWYQTDHPLGRPRLPVSRLDAPDPEEAAPARAHVGKTPWISRQDAPWAGDDV